MFYNLDVNDDRSSKGTESVVVEDGIQLLLDSLGIRWPSSSVCYLVGLATPVLELHRIL